MSSDIPRWIRKKGITNRVVQQVAVGNENDSKLADGRTVSTTSWDLPAQVPCLLCLEQGKTACLYRRLTNTHFKKEHGDITLDDYRRKFPDAPIGDYTKSPETREKLRQTWARKKIGQNGAKDHWMTPSSIQLVQQRAADELDRLRTTERLLERAKNRYDEAWDNYMQQKDEWLKHQKALEDAARIQLREVYE